MRRLAPLLALLAGLLVAACGDPTPEPVRGIDVRDVLAGGDLTGYERALAPRELVFPADHGPHRRFRTEWWYFTGNLEGGDGRAFGFQLTFFRSAVAPDAPARASRWATTQVWMAHFAVSDAAGQRLHASERFARGALGLAGAEAEPFRVWLADWRAESSDDGFLPLHLAASDGDVGIDLVLSDAKPIVRHGDAGLSRKGAMPGNASYYYSIPRFRVAGSVRLADGDHVVRGSAWLDREWSTSVLGPDQVGWDWFALQLDDGSEVMVYRIRRRDGSADPASSGTFVAPGGDARAAGPCDLTVLDHWLSPHDGTRYPGRWRLALPEQELVLAIEPLFADQELRLGFRYYEGAVTVIGTRRGEPVRGRGYVELTGYHR